MSFLRLVHAEWTKFRTVRGWLVGVVAAVFVLVGIGIVSAAGSHLVAAGPGGGPRQVTTGPGGEEVQDDFTFVHRRLDGDGSLTLQVASLAGDGAALNPWAKAGIMVKKSVTPGSTYAAVLLTGGHGTRLQYDFTGDLAGPAGARWLRLVRAGSTITGYASADGTTWTRVGATRLSGLPATAEIGMFVTSPPNQIYHEEFGNSQGDIERTRATAVFSGVSLTGGTSGGDWRQDEIGGDPGVISQDAGRFIVAGSGNIAPAAADGPGVIERTLVGTFGGLTVLIVLGTLFITTEYRRKMIATTFAASPRRGRVLAAKAVVIGAVAFVAGLVAAMVAVPWAGHMLEHNGAFITPVGAATEARMMIGTAALAALVAVLALSLGTLLRRGAGAIAGAVVLIVLPYLLASAAVLPAGPANWLLRLTPAAAFAVQQTIPVYSQIDVVRTPALGYFPLSPWAGFAVLCAYAAVAFGLAIYVVRRRDA
jgi:ABC-type transport system involved in multi-copper enzyme maturation permease subunit